MNLKEVAKCIKYLNEETSGLTLKYGNFFEDDHVRRWFPSDLTWMDWIAKYHEKMSVLGENRYTMRVASKTYVEEEYPFRIKFVSADNVNTYSEFKDHVLHAFDLLTKAREQKAAYLEKWKKEQIKKAAGEFEV